MAPALLCGSLIGSLPVVTIVAFFAATVFKNTRLGDEPHAANHLKQPTLEEAAPFLLFLFLLACDVLLKITHDRQARSVHTLSACAFMMPAFTCCRCKVCGGVAVLQQPTTWPYKTSATHSIKQNIMRQITSTSSIAVRVPQAQLLGREREEALEDARRCRGDTSAYSSVCRTTNTLLYQPGGVHW